MTFLSLFTGIGGLDLAAEWAGMECVGQCEWADFPTLVLEKHWPDTPRWRDIRTLTGDDFFARTGHRTVDLICGGFPCQPFSTAGKRGGKEDDRYLWPEMLRVVREIRPTWVVGENVAGIISMELDQVLADLEAEGYAARTFVLPACGVDAPHRRYRVAIVGYAEHDGSIAAKVAQSAGARSEGVKAGTFQAGKLEGSGRQCKDMADASSAELERPTGPKLFRKRDRPAKSGTNVANAKVRWKSELPERDNRKENQWETQVGYGTGTGCRGNFGDSSERITVNRGIATEIPKNVANAQSERRGEARRTFKQSSKWTSGRGANVADTERERSREEKNQPHCDGQRHAPAFKQAGEAEYSAAGSGCGPDTDTDRKQSQGRTQRKRIRIRQISLKPSRIRRDRSGRRNHKPLKPGLGGMADGVACWLDEPESVPRTVTGRGIRRADRLKALGNAVVPQQFYPVFKAIAEITKQVSM